MLKEKMLPISIICLSISIIISACIISKGMRSNGEYIRTGLGDIGNGLYNISSNISQYNNRELSNNNYKFPEAAAYLNISQSELDVLLANKASGIPYIKIGNDYIFNKNALDKWLDTARIRE